jgi:hypothetical protein
MTYPTPLARSWTRGRTLCEGTARTRQPGGPVRSLWADATRQGAAVIRTVYQPRGGLPVLRYTRWVLGLVVLVSMTGGEARAQWGYGGWGWCGWGGGVATPESAALEGAGSYAMGAGMYNLDTAQARSINADTAMRFNEYTAAVSDESARVYAARNNQQYARNRSAYETRRQQLRTTPEKRDIESGEALNLAVEDLSDPKLGSAAMRASKAPVSASLIGTVPFIYASERVTLMLDDIRASIKWPEVFEDARFVDDKKTFDELAARIRQETNDGEVSAKSRRDATAFGQNLRAKLDAQPLKDPEDQKEALRFLAACTSVMAMLEKPNIGPALIELRKIQDTMIGNLLGFMHFYNLRFGPAKTIPEKRAYQQLFEILDATRDQVLAEAKIDRSARALQAGSSKAATDFFHNAQKGRQSPAAPARSNPQ